MYYKVDKRLSVVKFQDLLKKRIKGQKGGVGWRIGVVNAHDYVIDTGQPATPSVATPSPLTPGIMFGTPSPGTPVIMFGLSPTTQSPATPSPSPQSLPQDNVFYLKQSKKKYNKDGFVGSGSFADVYNCLEDPKTVVNTVVKIFKPTSLGTKTVENTIACIEEFITQFNSLLGHTSFITTQTSPDIFVTQTQSSQDVVGYIMRKLTPIKTESLSYELDSGVLKCIEFENAKSYQSDYEVRGLMKGNFPFQLDIPQQSPQCSHGCFP
jgi:hypothetical protein